MTLTVENLSVGRAGRRLLENLSFEAAPGTAVILRGPNGVGKTTLLRTLAGFLPPMQGTARLEGATLHDRDGLQEHVAYAGHLDSLKAALTLEENLGFWAKLYGTSMEDAAAAFDLTPLLDRPAGLCSAGQKRRAGLARMVLAGRICWLMDEPTVALDAASRARLAEALAEHRRAGGIVVLATHDADIVEDPQTLHLTAATHQSSDPFLADFAAS